MLFPSAKSDYADAPTYFRSNQGRIAGGLIIVPSLLIDWLDSKMQKYNSRIVRVGVDDIDRTSK